MILKTGDRVLVVHRRLFEKDSERLFVGVVEEYENGIARVAGFTFARETLGRNFLRKDEQRTKIISIASGTLMVYRLPEEVAVDKLQIVPSHERLILSDDRGFEMNLSEHMFRIKP